MMRHQASVVSLVLIVTVFSIFCPPSSVSASRATGFGFRSFQRPVHVPKRAGQINNEAPASSPVDPDRRLHSRTTSMEESWFRREARVVPSDDDGGYDYKGGTGSSNAPVPTNEDGDENSPTGTPMSGGAVGDAPPPAESMYTFVEGTAFDNRVSEVEAMGGDPFFLVDDDASATSNDDSATPEEELPSLASFTGFGGVGVDGVIGSSGGGDGFVESWSVTDGNGPREIVEDVLLDEWDGWEVEDAHFD